MWSAACKGVSPSVREIPRGSAPLVKRRKANSKSSCLKHMRSGLPWLSWRPSGRAERGRRDGTVSSDPRKRHSLAHSGEEAAPPIMLLTQLPRCSYHLPSWKAKLLSAFRRKSCSFKGWPVHRPWPSHLSCLFSHLNTGPKSTHAQPHWSEDRAQEWWKP
jgi:hypothetical protein